VTLIGSRQRAHIRLESDDVSRSHAAVVNADGRVVIRDLASRTHLFINGRQIREAVLQEGDYINIGHFALRFAAGEPALPLDVGDDPDHGASVDASAVLTGDGLDAGGVGLGRALCVVGCRRGVDLVLRGSEVSFAHALIFWDLGRHFIRDLGSRTGTFLDGTAVEGDAEIRPGSVLRIGPYRLRYSMGGAAPAAAPSGQAVGTAPPVAPRMPEISAAAETWFPPGGLEPAKQPKTRARPAAAHEPAIVPGPPPAALPPAIPPTPELPPATAKAVPVPASVPVPIPVSSSEQVDRPDAPADAAPTPAAPAPSVTATVHSGDADLETTDEPADEFELAEAATIDPTPVATHAPDELISEASGADNGDPYGGYEPIGLALAGQTLVDEVVVPAMQFEPPVFVVASMTEVPPPAAHSDATPATDDAPPAGEAEVEAAAWPEPVVAEEAGPAEKADEFDEIGAVLDALEGQQAPAVANERQETFFEDTAAGIEPEPEPEAAGVPDLDLDLPEETSTDAAAPQPQARYEGEREHEMEPEDEGVSEYEREPEHEPELERAPEPVARPAAAEIKPPAAAPVRPAPGAKAARPRIMNPEPVASPPPPTWGVLAAAVALAEAPHLHEARAAAAAEEARTPRRGRGWLKFIAALILVAAVAGVVFVFLKIDASAAIRRYL
jgi:pSer/pThr/pTyr-binding forkhead associated (FHA) protein